MTNPKSDILFLCVLKASFIVLVLDGGGDSSFVTTEALVLPPRLPRPLAVEPLAVEPLAVEPLALPRKNILVNSIITVPYDPDIFYL